MHLDAATSLLIVAIKLFVCLSRQEEKELPKAHRRPSNNSLDYLLLEGVGMTLRASQHGVERGYKMMAKPPEA